MAKSNKGNTTKFLEGTMAGVALGVAASMFLASKEGKSIKINVVKSIKDTTADFYKSVSPKIKKMEKMGEKEYKEFMKNSAEQYVSKKKISEDIAKQLIKEVQQSWSHFSRHLGLVS